MPGTEHFEQMDASATRSQSIAPTADGGEARLEVAQLVVQYGDTRAVDDVSFSAGNSEQLSFLGPSGCGKTSILRAIAGLERPTSGEIRIDQKLVFSRASGYDVPAEQRGISMMFQSYAIWPHMSVFDNVAYGLRVQKQNPATVKEKVEWALGLMHMQDFARRSASKLSGGQQQRVALARAIAFSPRILLFDNPLSNLDARLRVEMRVELRELQQALGFTSIYVTHDQEEALAISDRVIVMNAGRVEQIGTPEEIYNRPRNRFVAAFVGSANLIAGRVGESGPAPGRVPFSMLGGVPLQVVTEHPLRGNEAEVAIRTAHIILGSPGKVNGVNAVPGRIRQRLFHGDFVQYVVDWPAGELVVRRPPTEILEEGANIIVSFTPERCVLLEPAAETLFPDKLTARADELTLETPASSAQPSEPRIEVSNLFMQYGDVRAVNGVSFTVQPGEQLALLGPSGCGKTTTLRAIAGLELPTSGEILIDGKRMHSGRLDVPTERRGISMVFQSFAVWPHMSVFANVAYGLRGRGFDSATIAKKVEWALRMMRMESYAERSPGKLSGGQQQRIALARAIAISPKVLLFDEPLSNLDAKLRSQMRIELRELQRKLQPASVYVTHDQEEAFAISDRIIVMNDGRIEQMGSPEEIYNRPRNRFVADFVGSANLIAGRVKGTVREPGVFGFEAWEGAPLQALALHGPKGDETEVAVRTAHIVLGPPAKGANTVTGHIRRRLFYGDFIQYIVDWPAGQLVVRRPPTDVFEEGAEVVVSFAPEHCILLEK